jgi:putative transcriptional regulator
MNNTGKVIIKLEQLLESKGISKNKLSHIAEMERTQINNYCKNKITRIDTDVLARLCFALDCTVGDLIEYVPATEEENKRKSLSTK